MKKPRLNLKRKSKELFPIIEIVIYKKPKPIKYKLKRIKFFKRYTLKRYSGPTFPRYELRCKERIEAIKLISKAISYCSTSEKPKITSLNSNEVCFRLSEQQKDMWIDLISKRDERIIKYELEKGDSYLIITMKGVINKFNYIIFTTEEYIQKKKRRNHSDE